MQTVEKKDLEVFMNQKVQVCIHGEEGEEMAPWVDRKIEQLTLCPDETHLRIYFDKHFFVAVPLTSSVEKDKHKWVAFDKKARLFYAIKK